MQISSLLKSAASVRRKRYVLALQRNVFMSEQENKLIVKATEHALPGYTLIRLDDPAEGLKVLNVKDVEIVILHHSFFSSEVELVEYAKELKARKSLTVLFVTKNERALIDAYRDKMSLYEETDDYVTSPPDPSEIFRKLQKFGKFEARAAKRFLIDVPAQVTRVESLEQLIGQIDDLSLVGCGLIFTGDHGFRSNEQLRFQFPLYMFGVFHPTYGDYLKLALKVRRFSIRGDSIGCSIEHMTPMQKECLSNLLEEISRRQRIYKLTTKEVKGAPFNAK